MYPYYLAAFDFSDATAATTFARSSSKLKRRRAGRPQGEMTCKRRLSRNRDMMPSWVVMRRMGNRRARMKATCELCMYVWLYVWLLLYKYVGTII